MAIISGIQYHVKHRLKSTT